MVHVALDWHKIEWQPDFTWKKNVVPQLEALGISLAAIRRCVYVIRLDGDYCIDYPNAPSPTIYIGEGNFNQRITQHRKWVTDLKHLVGEFSFQVCVAIPRVQNSPEAYRDAEAALISHFGNKYGTTPMWNKQYEQRLFPRYHYAERSFNEAIGIRQGTRYSWAIRPMRSSPLHKFFKQPPR